MYSGFLRNFLSVLKVSSSKLYEYFTKPECWSVRKHELILSRTFTCRSLQVSEGLASRARATIPAARGADALVPVCMLVHAWCKSVVTWKFIRIFLFACFAYDHLLPSRPRRVCRCESAAAGLGIPRDVAVFSGRRDGQGVDAENMIKWNNWTIILCKVFQ